MDKALLRFTGESTYPAFSASPPSLLLPSSSILSPDIDIQTLFHNVQAMRDDCIVRILPLGMLRKPTAFVCRNDTTTSSVSTSTGEAFAFSSGVEHSTLVLLFVCAVGEFSGRLAAGADAEAVCCITITP